MFKRLFGRGEPARKAADDAALVAGLAPTRRGLGARLGEILGTADITEDTWESLEVALIQADVGAPTALDIVQELRTRARNAGARRASELPAILRVVMVRALQVAGEEADAEDLAEAAEGASADAGPTVVFMVGVNGSGKTTTIAKLAKRYHDQGQRVLLVAGDTFRAAAIEQLQTWGARLGVNVAAGAPGADPSSVVFDALASKTAREADIILVDSAGRLHTQHNLMAELVKVRGIIARQIPGAPHQTLLVLDAHTGQNGLAQAKAFTSAVKVDGLVLAKLDSSAKGGVAFAVTRSLGLPVRFVGTGEGMGDLEPFDAASYVAGLLGSLAG